VFAGFREAVVFFGFRFVEIRLMNAYLSAVCEHAGATTVFTHA
jgi:hypothetical protein